MVYESCGKGLPLSSQYRFTPLCSNSTMSIEMSIVSLNKVCFGQLGTIKIAFAPDCFSFCTARGKTSKGGLIQRGSDESPLQASSWNFGNLFFFLFAIAST